MPVELGRNLKWPRPHGGRDRRIRPETPGGRRPSASGGPARLALKACDREKPARDDAPGDRAPRTRARASRRPGSKTRPATRQAGVPQDGAHSESTTRRRRACRRPAVTLGRAFWNRFADRSLQWSFDGRPKCVYKFRTAEFQERPCRARMAFRSNHLRLPVASMGPGFEVAPDGRLLVLIDPFGSRPPQSASNVTLDCLTHPPSSIFLNHWLIARSALQEIDRLSSSPRRGATFISLLGLDPPRPFVVDLLASVISIDFSETAGLVSRASER